MLVKPPVLRPPPAIPRLTLSNAKPPSTPATNAQLPSTPAPNRLVSPNNVPPSPVFSPKSFQIPAKVNTQDPRYKGRKPPSLAPAHVVKDEADSKDVPLLPSVPKPVGVASTTTAVTFDADGEFRNHRLDVLQKQIFRRNKEIILEFPLTTDADISPPECDLKNAKTWIFPTNIDKRDYQYNIIENGLFENSLVVLPTGLGKTFIAGVIMYNFYRWFPNGKIVFMAPTRPLVDQQVNAVHGYVGFPPEDVAMITGTTVASANREKVWQQKRIFFVTPQIIMFDIEKGAQWCFSLIPFSGKCDASSIVLLIVDEAHRAQRNHAYCRVVKLIAKHTPHFRILALTATPGSSIDTIQQVICNLLISRIEVREEEDVDVQQYIKNKIIEIKKVKLTNSYANVQDLFFKLAKIPLDELCNAGVFYTRNPENVCTTRKKK